MKKRLNNRKREQVTENTHFAGTFGGPGAFMQKGNRRNESKNGAGSTRGEETSQDTYRPSGTLC